MVQVVSGASRERIVRSLALLVIVDGFAAAFLWDGFAGYARKNAAALAQSLGLAADGVPPTNPKLTAAEGRRLAAALTNPATAADPLAPFAPPALKRDDEAYYLGPGGHLRVRAQRGRVVEAAWSDGVHSETDQTLQRWIGIVLAGLGLVTAVQFVRVTTSRIAITDEGVEVGHRQRIPWAAVTGIRAEGVGRATRAQIEYVVDGRPRALKLDDYQVGDLDKIVAAACKGKGVPNPVKPPPTA